MFRSNTPTPIDIEREFKKESRKQKNFQDSYVFDKENNYGVRSFFWDPYTGNENYYANLKSADRRLNRQIPGRTLRRVAEKAFIINTCIGNIQDKIRPFLKPSTNINYRGFIVKKKGDSSFITADKKSKERDVIENFLMNTGIDKDSSRDKFMHFCLKIVRDLFILDQAATEIAYTRSGKPYAFFAIDGETIEKILPYQENPHNIQFVQLINELPVAYYTEGQLIFDYQNPRTDIRFSMYGYSRVEQAVDL
ncbi:MAG: hypothetical protein ACRC4W_02335, partial [Treponemataceae bacterium]